MEEINKVDVDEKTAITSHYLQFLAFYDSDVDHSLGVYPLIVAKFSKLVSENSYMYFLCILI